MTEEPHSRRELRKQREEAQPFSKEKLRERWDDLNAKYGRKREENGATDDDWQPSSETNDDWYHEPEDEGRRWQASEPADPDEDELRAWRTGGDSTQTSTESGDVADTGYDTGAGGQAESAGESAEYQWDDNAVWDDDQGEDVTGYQDDVAEGAGQEDLNQGQPTWEGEDYYGEDGEPLTRQESIELTKRQLEEERTTNLKHRLNKVILILVALIILDYLILFFVG